MTTFTDHALETVELDTPTIINQLYKHGQVQTPTELIGSDGFSVFKYQSQSALVLVHQDNIFLVKDIPEFSGVKTRDAAQSCFLWSLKNRALTVCLGSAGSGKTYLSTAFAVHSLEKEGKNVVLLKPTRFVGGDSNAIAAVPGGINEKLEPYVESFQQHLRTLVGWGVEQKMMDWQNKRMLEFAAVELCRGRHFANSVVILDEAQNLSFHELSSVISRVDDTSKLIILGDPLQIDTPDTSWEDTGLSKLLDSTAWYTSDFAAAVELHTSYRGKMANLVAEALLELRGL